jgi:hypothetical protein
MKATLDTVPVFLGEHGRRLWLAIVGELSLGESGRAQLEDACVLADRAHQARCEMLDSPLCQVDRFGQPKVDPRVLVERASLAESARIIDRLSRSSSGGGDAVAVPGADLLD